MDENFQKPAAFDFPEEFLFANINESGAVHGWELETLIAELLACKRDSGPRQLNIKAWASISEIVNALREIGNAESALIGPDRIFRAMFRTLHRQLPWQMHSWNAADAVRWWSIFHSDLLRTIFRERMGTELRSFIKIGMAWSQILNANPFCPRPATAPALRLSESDVDAFIKATCATLAQAEVAARANVSSSPEIEYRQSALRAKPIIAVSREGTTQYIRPIEQLLIWRITSGIYYDVIGDRRAANEIGFQYEMYTRRLVAAAFPELSLDADVEYGSKQNPQRSPDCVLHSDRQIEAVIECKAKKIPLVVQNAIEDTKERETAVDELAKGVVQLCRFEGDVRANAAKGFRLSDDPTMLVVALDDWVFTGPDLKNDVFDRAQTIAATEGVNSERIAQRKVALCTATELDQLVSTFKYDAIKRIIAKSYEEQYKGYTLTSVGNECFAEEKHEAKYPLKESLDDLIGL